MVLVLGALPRCCFLAFYQIIIVALSLIMSLIKIVSFLDDIIYVFNSLYGCSFSWIPRSTNLAADCLINLSETRIGPLVS